MPLPWVRLDCNFSTNPKLLSMITERDGHRAGLVYLCSLGYSGAHGLDGFLPAECLPFIHGRMADVEKLVRHGFWRDQPGGWLIHGWDEFQESNAETQARRARAQGAAMARWEGHEPLSRAERQRNYRARKAAQNGGEQVRDDARDDA